MDTKVAVAVEGSDPVVIRGPEMRLAKTRTMMVTTGERGTRDTRTSDKLTSLLLCCDLMTVTNCMDFSLEMMIN